MLVLFLKLINFAAHAEPVKMEVTKLTLKIDESRKYWRVLASAFNLFVFWLIILPRVGFTYYLEQRVFELSLIVLASSVIPLLLVRNQIKEFNGFRKDLSAEQLTFLLTALIVIPSALVLDPFYPASGILILPLLEEWFFRGLLLPTLATINAPMAIAVSSIMFSLTHYFHYEPTAFFSILILGTASAICQAYYRSIFLPMSIHILWNWYANYNNHILYGSGLTYFGGLALGISYVFGWLLRRIWDITKLGKTLG